MLFEVWIRLYLSVLGLRACSLRRKEALGKDSGRDAAGPCARQPTTKRS